MTTHRSRHTRDLHKIVLFVVVVAALFSFSYASTAGEPLSLVEYANGVLVVAGARYERNAEAPEHATGTVVVVAQANVDRAQVEDLISRLGLRVAETFSNFPEVYVVAVRSDYETQWVAALNQQGLVKSASVNRRARPS